MRRRAEMTGMKEQVLLSKLDALWAKVTLYNCYQIFVQLASKKLKNPSDDVRKEYANFKILQSELNKAHQSNDVSKVVMFTEQLQSSIFYDMTEIEIQNKIAESQALNEIWEQKPEYDMLSLLFSATEMLPRNSMRTLVNNANNSLKTMGGAEKMLASVQAIAVTAMSFFTDPTISTLTSGSPSQNVDLAGLSFPRRLGVRFSAEFLEKNHLIGQRVIWQAYSDPYFKESLGKEFYHEDIISRVGWAKYLFEGVFPKEVAYIKLQIIDSKTGLLTSTFYFRFQKGYQTSLDGRYYVKDPVLSKKIILDGILTELKPVRDKSGKVKFVRGKTTIKKKVLHNVLGQGECGVRMVDSSAIISTMVKYNERPKIVFLVTPPHLMSYAKLILILIKQLVDLNFDQSYSATCSTLKRCSITL